MEITVEVYAKVMAELAAERDERAEILSRHGLDEASWERSDAHWQDQLSAAIGAEGDVVGPLLSAFTVAYEAAQRNLAPPITLEQFARATRLLSVNDDPHAASAKAGISLADYARGSEHWSRRLVADPELERRFATLLRQGD